MRNWTERYNLASRHVADGRRVIARQRALIDRQKTMRQDTGQSEDLLASFQESQGIFEDDLARIRNERA